VSAEPRAAAVGVDGLHPAVSAAKVASVGVPTISTRRLELVSMSPALLVALLGDQRQEAARILAATIPKEWPDATDTRFLRLRLEEMQRDPAAQQWLVRAIVRRESTPQMLGHAGFHGPPELDDQRKPHTLELGYAVFPDFRGHGYAIEAAAALIGWARVRHNVRRFIASIGPDNDASLAIVRRLGFVQTGQQWDDEDGLELVFELEATSDRRFGSIV
jgi:RimJ/RimL family protein N-acetyltransferase